MQAEIQDQTTAPEAAAAAATEQNVPVQALQHQISQLIAEKAALNDAVAAQADRVLEADRDLQAAQAAFKSIARQVDAADSSIETVSTAISALQADTDTVRLHREEAVAALLTANTAMADFNPNADMSVAKTELAFAKTELAAAKAEFENKTAVNVETLTLLGDRMRTVYSELKQALPNKVSTLYAELSFCTHGAVHIMLQCVSATLTCLPVLTHAAALPVLISAAASST